MTEMEEKSLKTQIELLKDINYADTMIIRVAQGNAMQIFNEFISPKMYTKDSQKTVEFTVEEFAKLRVEIVKLMNDEGFAKMNDWINLKYIEPKKEKQKILSMLQ